MANRLWTKAQRILEARYDETEELYLRHCEAAETLVRDANRFAPITLAHFAAGQAALEAAWTDGAITGEHARFLQGYTAVVRRSVDDFNEREAGFEVEISPPLPMLGEPDAVAD